MSDQAEVLRELIERQVSRSVETVTKPGRSTGVVAVTSGKGGVGKSTLAVNLGLAIAEQQTSVCLLDANLGLGNLDLLCGLNGYWNLSHVITGARSLRDVILRGPAGVQLVPGASGLIDVADCSEAAQREILSQMEELEKTHDFLIVDTGTGIHRPVRTFVEAADVALIVTTPEPTSIADAYATIKAFSSAQHAVRLQLLVNQAESSQQARLVCTRLQQTTRIFLRGDVEYAGYIPYDPNVRRSVVRRHPFILDCPDTPASQAVRHLASRLRSWQPETEHRDPFFARLRNQLTRKAA